MDADGIITVTMNNLSIESEETVDIQLAENGYKVVEAKVVTENDMHAMNTFEAPETVTEKDLTGYTETAEGIRVVMPKNSVVELRLKK